jgi:methylmalonyl-CoA/ethylmalonyl-CoA epimerase
MRVTRLHHVAIALRDMAPLESELAEKGLRFRAGMPMAGQAGSGVAFLDPASTGGVLFELLEPARGGAGRGE